MFKVYWTNHGYYSPEQFASLDAAVAYGKGKGFEFSVVNGDQTVAYWTVFGGLHTV